MFKALLLTEKDGKVSSQITQLDEERLPEGDVTVRVQYSTLNYKDGLILNGLGRLVRNYPHVPGVDFAGVVEASQHPRFKLNDLVVLTGWRVGEAHWGGYAVRHGAREAWRDAGGRRRAGDGRGRRRRQRRGRHPGEPRLSRCRFDRAR